MFQGHTDELWGLDVHPSMEQFVTCSQDRQVHLWDTSSHQPLWSKTIEVTGLSGFEYCNAVMRQRLTEDLTISFIWTNLVLLPFVLQDQGRSVGFHPSGAVLAVGTMTGRSVSQLLFRI